MNRQKILQTLKEFIRIESVSTDPKRFSEVEKACNFLEQKLRSLGFRTKKFQKKGAPPLLVAEYKVKRQASSAKRQEKNTERKTLNSEPVTIGIYGHYDVQPEDPKEEWKTSPFEVAVKDGKIWGRGTADNKGHVIQNIAAVAELITQNALQCNVVFILEGEEETGSVHLGDYLHEAKDILSDVDVYYVTDVGMHDRDVPQIFYGLRGLIYYELKITIGARDLHSGIYGNRVYNPINVLSDLIARIKDVRSGKILIPHFYDDVRVFSKKELQGLATVKRTDAEEKKEAGTFVVIGQNHTYPYLAAKIYPSFDVHGIIAGYTGPGSKTVIPRSAQCKFSFRLVEHQNPDTIEKLVRAYIKKELPDGARYELSVNSKDAPFYTDSSNKYVKKTKDSLQSVFKHAPLLNRSGGSIPAAEMFQRLFKKPIILIGFTLPDENLHAPNENFDEEMFWKGIEALKKIYSNV